jgi:hypothetical protein
MPSAKTRPFAAIQRIRPVMHFVGFVRCNARGETMFQEQKTLEVQSSRWSALFRTSYGHERAVENSIGIGFR